MKYNTNALGLIQLESILQGLPQFKSHFLMIQVAGTNGKGSTCNYIYSYLKKTSQKVALFSSPHLYDIKERIELNGEKISQVQFDQLETEVDLLLKGHLLGFFEKLCLIFMLFCQQEQVDIAVVEVGLGGRLDPTNLISDHKLTLLTSISLDHQKILGYTIQEISLEKLGICRSGCPLFVSHQLAQNPNIESYCQKFGIEQIATSEVQYMHCPAQNSNAGLAKSLLQFLGYENGIDTMFKGCHQAGRLDHFGDQNLMDVCHNMESLSVLIHYIKNLETNYQKLYFNFLKSKDYQKMIPILENLKIPLILVELHDSRTLSSKSLKETSIAKVSQDHFLENVTKLKNSLVIGCFPLVGQVIQRLKLETHP